MAPRQKEPFSILNMKNTFDDVSETLYKAIKKQNPDVSADSLDMALRNLVMNYGSSPLYSPMNGVIASIQESQPIYIEAADMLILARREFLSGNHEEALKLFVLSQDADNVDELFDALTENNAKSELGIVQATTIDNSKDNDVEPDEDSENNDEDWEDVPLYDLNNSDDEDSEDDDSDDSDDNDEDEELEAKVKQVAARLKVIAEDTDETELEEDENTDNTANNEILQARLKRIAANKVSMDGMDKSIDRTKYLKKAS